MAWAEALRHVIDDAQAQSVMGSAARQLARAYSWEASAELLLEAYAETESNHRRVTHELFG